MRSRPSGRTLARGVCWAFAALWAAAPWWAGAALAQGPPPERKVRAIEFLITTPGYDPIRHDWAVMVAENWKKLGVDVKIRPVETGVMIKEGLRNHNYDAVILSWGGKPERMDPDFFCYTISHSSQAVVRGYNMNNWRDPEFDKVAERQRTALDLKARKAAVDECQRRFMEALPEIPIIHQNYLHAYNKADFTDVVPMMGEGLGSFWNFVRIAPKTGRKVLRFGHPEALRTLNPVAVVGLHELTIFRILFDTLMRVDEKGEPIPWAAEKVTVVDDRTVDATLRPGMTFHDGKPVTAEDVKFSYEYYRKWKGGGFDAALKPVERIEVRGPLSVRFHLKQPHAPFLSITFTSIYILPKHIWQDVPRSVGKEAPQDWSDWKKAAVGSGPFRFVDWKRGEELRLARFDAHWSKPKVEGVLRIAYADMQGLVFAIQRREVDVVGWNISPLQVRVLKGVPQVEVVNVPNHGYYPVHLNLDRKPFDDLAFRKALAHAIPRERIVNDFYEGFAVEATSPIGPMNKFWYNPDVPKYEFSIERARQILKEAGYAWDSQGKLYYPPGKTN